MNWVDVVIILVLIFFIHQGFVNGFWSILIDFVSFFGSLLISLQIYKTVSISNALVFLVSAIIIEIVLSFILSFLIKKLPHKILKNNITKITGVILSFGQAVILIAFVLTLALSFPISPLIKSDISNSKIGSYILAKTPGIGKNLPKLTYLTVEPKSHESIPLGDTSLHLTVDRDGESKMLDFINKERTTRSISPLTLNAKLIVVAENYAKLMWTDKYFGHYDPDGHDIGYRLDKAGMSYTIAGENLALAPTVDIAHTGLMNSPGHKANILEIKFNKVGIGVVDNGYYGKMFVQVFTD